MQMPVWEHASTIPTGVHHWSAIKRLNFGGMRPPQQDTGSLQAVSVKQQTQCAAQRHHTNVQHRGTPRHAEDDRS